MATKTKGFKVDKLSTSTQTSVGILFLNYVVELSAKLYQLRYELREEAFEQEHPDSPNIATWIQGLLDAKDGRAQPPGTSDQPLDEGYDTDEAKWTTEEDDDGEWLRRRDPRC